jgi:hypothetical protein
MKTVKNIIVFIISLSILFSCAASAYITDEDSIKRQKEMRKHRTGINFVEGFYYISVWAAALAGTSIDQGINKRSFRKMVLINNSKDTLFVNMVTDYLWSDSTYCDIREIVLPQMQKAKVIVPMEAVYNIYFRNDYFAPDDEKKEVRTSNTGRVRLKPIKEKLAVKTGD